jgi:hypothetical protein
MSLLDKTCLFLIIVSTVIWGCVQMLLKSDNPLMKDVSCQSI